MKQLEIEQIQCLLADTFKRFRKKEITKEDAKCEADLLKIIAELNEISRIKEQVQEVKSLLTTNKK